ncbi:winged helix-turn-helix transcriptional regulator [Serratia fonticola]|uniref:winged helix-turn-helix transcriptional regulator n=1 Tax=Serratia fonticola TaxID=47917 RepID=UPI0008FCEF54|nr:helix-turn-helix domain-containing protein [Serratia fonticola]MBC3250286.1 helix-turn-helix transcriptional regulator [Serratia fonticola]MBP0995618.1 helix-turn-helix transcriptional regulator [Serratia fonticola]MBP1000964.1 helix-turn-helix transcriptional regulator [Serratia fonticola]MBP1010479.1 helix-turn-helix transcriptional regulator [Serratia fonticola]OIX96291.1 transcriptional regulator [Serratia fonticola]
MKKTSFATTPCPIARSLGRVGEWWSILILRDAFHGLSKFDEFQQSLGLSPTLLTRRLKFLVESGILYKQRYQTRPVRYQYLLTERGKDFFPVLVTLFQWGNTHLTEGAHSAELVDRRSGQPIQPLLIDALTQQPIALQHITLAAGPAAGEAMSRRASLMQHHYALLNESSKESL